MRGNFEDLEVWKKSCQLAVLIYKELKSWSDYGLKDQMNRAAVSIASNIAEGNERETNKDFIRFIVIAKSSAAELRTQLYIARKIEYLDINSFKLYLKELKSISRMLQALINNTKKNMD